MQWHLQARDVSRGGRALGGQRDQTSTRELGFEERERTFLDVEEAGLHVAPYAMPSESELLIYVCRGWRRPLEEAWREARFFI